MPQIIMVVAGLELTELMQSGFRICVAPEYVTWETMKGNASEIKVSFVIHLGRCPSL